MTVKVLKRQSGMSLIGCPLTSTLNLKSSKLQYVSSVVSYLDTYFPIRRGNRFICHGTKESFCLLHTTSGSDCCPLLLHLQVSHMLGYLCGTLPLISLILSLFLKINLRHGVAKGETVETCMSVLLVGSSNVIWPKLIGTAGAGSLILEFATLSRLTGDDRFEKAAHKVWPIQISLLSSSLIYNRHFSVFGTESQR